MSADHITLTIDGVRVSVPKGTLLVDAAKQAGIDIPVFCYHPKMKPVGMCRMCLVEIGRPAIDRASGKPLLGEDGQPVIQFGPKLETACTTPVGEGWVVRGLSDKVREGRREVLEFLLTSHPLDCPVCDKGGECPLQNLTMAHGPGKSRFQYEDKMHLDKRVPLGDLIVLDRERCIQCGRCVRFQEEVVDDPVLGFTQRGRSLEITTFSNPGFDSVFSGNTTDICPVGALTTMDFRFEARPWELNAAASICPHCPVGCNLTLNTRRQPGADGRILVQRVLPRQNEAVNEIWICDKGRFGHHYAGSSERLRQPLVRNGRGSLIEVSWAEALTKTADGLKRAAGKVVGLAGGRASNEDLFNFRQLIHGVGGRAVLDSPMAGGDMVRLVGAGSELNLGRLGQGDAVLVIACDLHEEAPIWWLRLKQAAERGAQLVVVNARPTRLEAHATQVLRIPFGMAAQASLSMLRAVDNRAELAPYPVDDEVRNAARTIAGAIQVVIFYGGEGLDYRGTEALARGCAALLQATGHAGKPGSGLVAVWPDANTQGGWDIGLRPEPEGTVAALLGAGAVYLLACDPARGHATVASALEGMDFVVVQDLFLTETARRADVILPAQAFTEREGSYTSGERRVQRFYPAVPALSGTKPDWQILAEVGAQLGIRIPSASAAAVMEAIAGSVPEYAGISYAALASVEPQWPMVGGDDLYYGGTAYRNEQGLGVHLTSAAERGEAVQVELRTPPAPPATRALLLVPVARLYESTDTLAHSDVLANRLVRPTLVLHPQEAARLRVEAEDPVEVRWNGRVEQLPVELNEGVPAGVGLVSRRSGLGLRVPTAVDVRTPERTNP
ncbi:MAG: NADH-quinone oxidoreductase subunit NuoG [Chloroflexota bacterium]